VGLCFLSCVWESCSRYVWDCVFCHVCGNHVASMCGAVFSGVWSCVFCHVCGNHVAGMCGPVFSVICPGIM